MRAAKQANSNTNKYYKSIAKWYAGIVYKIIGEDTKVIYEDDFYKYYAREYSNEYHKHYLEQIQQGSEILADSKESSSSFKRKLSNIESYFPVYMLAKKLCKRRQLYVLDRDKCLEDWVNDQSSNILQEIKKKYGFILLTAKTFTKVDRKMSESRKHNGCIGNINYCLFKDDVKKYYNERKTSCTMCGKYCPLKKELEKDHGIL